MALLDDEMGAPVRLTVRVESTPGGITRVVDAFESFGAAHGLEPSAVWPFQVALDEILSNIVGHGYAGRTDGVIDTTFALADGVLQVTVEDEAPAHNPLAVSAPDTSSPLEEREPGGLGVHFVRTLMDRVEYTRRENRNSLVFVRRVVG
jgi:serine/threonine-protein kinase RsbW